MGIPSALLDDPDTLESYLQDTYVKLHPFVDGGYKLYINPRLKGGSGHHDFRLVAAPSGQANVPMVLRSERYYVQDPPSRSYTSTYIPRAGGAAGDLKMLAAIVFMVIISLTILGLVFKDHKMIGAGLTCLGIIALLVTLFCYCSNEKAKFDGGYRGVHTIPLALCFFTLAGLMVALAQGGAANGLAITGGTILFFGAFRLCWTVLG